ncbi:MFS transporter [Dactylosporangium sp. NBC_01737]|uniref:MFS transporter n=1 Tax=Dactylosporangium sp. NBC_01737 TaxID=2975959 RepID=UPI002E12EA92|nr:MFS transporter [Dactylosporangium sp. NBC_01737]
MADAHPLRLALSVRGFRRLLSVRACSQFGDGIFQAALAGSVVFNPERQASALAVAVATAVVLLPYSLLGPYVGVLLDRWSRRSVIVASAVVRAVLVIPAALLTGVADQGVGFLAVALTVIGLKRFSLAAMSAATPHVVDERRLVTANAVSGTTGSIAFSAGLGCALVLVQTVVSAGYQGYGIVAALALVWYVVAAVVGYRAFEPHQLGPDVRTRPRGGLGAAVVEVGRGMLSGFGHLAARRAAASALAAQTAFRVLFGILTLALVLLFRNYFTGDGDVEGSLTALTGVFVTGAVGVFVGAALTPWFTRRIGSRQWITAVLTVAAVALLGLGLPFIAPLLLAVVFVLNVAAQSVKIVVDTLIQQEYADEYRGRIFSVNDTTFNLAYVAGMFLAAVTLPETGHSPMMLVAVALSLAAVAAGYGYVTGRCPAEDPGENAATATA